MGATTAISLPAAGFSRGGRDEVREEREENWENRGEARHLVHPWVKGMSQICSCQMLGAELGVGDATVGKGDDVPTVLHVLISLGKQTKGKKKMQINISA